MKPTASPTTVNATSESNYYLIKNLYDMFPSGVIMIWYGDINSIPNNWVLCDGNNSTPDLRDRFVIGAGNLYSLNDIGGINNITLEINNIPSHNHNITNIISSYHNGHIHNNGSYFTSTQTGHTHTFSDTTSSAGYHTHTYSATTSSNGLHTHTISNIRSDELDGDGSGGNDGYEHWSGYTISTNSAGSHTHTLSGTTSATSAHTHTVSGTSGTSPSHNHVLYGSSGIAGNHSHLINGLTDYTPNENQVRERGDEFDIINPYYALYYIMKV